MRRNDIVLAVLFVAAIVGLAFLPEMIEKWREDKEVPPADTLETVSEPRAEPEREALAEPQDPAAERERVQGMMMLHEACVDRFEGFAADSRDAVESWKERHAAILAEPAAGQDFHIVLGEPQGLEAEQLQQAAESTRELCDGNLEAMREEIRTAR